VAAGRIIYKSDGVSPIHASNVQQAARIFATRLARQKYGLKGHCRLLIQDTGPRWGTYVAFLGVLHGRGAAMLGEKHRFAVTIEREEG
jgi:hypothetical protein